MNIEVKCFATLARRTPEGGSLEIEAGATPADVMARLGIDPDEVKIIFVNGVHAKADSPLKDGDRLGLFPPVGGG
jgi:sulfur carrier protein ThiS